MKKAIVAEAKVSILDRLLEDVKLNEKVSKKMSEKELLEYVYEHFNDEDIKSKNGMLKHLRGSGLSCSMDRVFNMYMLVEKELKSEAKTDVK